MTFGKDPRTYDVAARILNEEVEHEAWFIELLAHERDGKSIPSATSGAVRRARHPTARTLDSTIHNACVGDKSLYGRMSTAASHLVTLEMPQGERWFQCDENEFVWAAAARNGISLPAICHQGRCLTCAGRLLAGSVDQSSADAYFPEDREAGSYAPRSRRRTFGCVLMSNGTCALIA